MLIEQHRHRPRRPSVSEAPGTRVAVAGSQSTPSSSVLCSFQDKNLSDIRRGRRINGLHLPLHPLQVTGWLTVLIFALATFLVVIPALKAPLRNYACVLLSSLFLVHILAHLTALLLDPADQELRRQHKSDRIIPEFDRSKHRHVIENSRCHLCNIQTSGPRTKHCSICNKCVENFDHHCRWLNHCIGSRNYTPFLLCVFSAVIATVTISGIIVTEVTLYFVSPQALNVYQWLPVESVSGTEVGGKATTTTTTTTTSAEVEVGTTTATIALITSTTTKTTATNTLPTDSSIFGVGGGGLGGMSIDENATLLVVPELLNVSNSISNNAASAVDVSAEAGGIPVQDIVFLVFITVIGLLATITAALLIHLCFFHVYISFLGLTTYEYIRNQRQTQQQVGAATTNAGGVVGRSGGTAPPPETSNAPVQRDVEQGRRTSSTGNGSSRGGSLEEQERTKGVNSSSFPLNKKTTRRRKLTRSTSIDRIFFCSSVKGKGGRLSATSPTCSSSRNPLKYFTENRANNIVRPQTNDDDDVEVAENNGGSGATAQPNNSSPEVSTECVVCSLIESRGREGATDFLCCTKIYNQEQINVTLGLDIEPGEGGFLAATTTTTTTTTTNALALVANRKFAPAAAAVNNNQQQNQAQRWHSKLYCCVTVPDSPDAHLDICHVLNANGRNCSAVRVDSQEIRASSAAQMANDGSNNIFRITLTEDDGKTTATQHPIPGLRPQSRRGVGPVRKYNRLRRLLRMVKLHRSAQEGFAGGTTLANSRGESSSLKINQVRPMPNPLQGNKATQVPSPAGAAAAAPPQLPATSVHANSTMAPSPKRKQRPQRGQEQKENNSNNNIIPEGTSTVTAQQSEISQEGPKNRRLSPDQSHTFSPPLGGGSGGGGGHHKIDPSLFSRRTRKKNPFRNQLSPIKESGMSNPNSPAPVRSHFFPTIS